MLFNTASPTNQLLSEAIKAQFTEVCAKIDGLKQWLEEEPSVPSSQHPETPPHLRNIAPEMSSENSYDSSKTKQKKAYWRAAKLAEIILRDHGFHISMDESPIHSWVNPIQRLLEYDYKPYLTFA